MGNYHPGEVVLLLFSFTDMRGAKRRPALVLLDTGDADVIVARVTSQVIQTAFDVELMDWQQAGLLLPSTTARVHKLATLEKRLIERRLGKLTAGDWAQVRDKIHQLWSSL
ncbi:MAG: type II toxin-antitoxin system PemK/MazF family toxin [Thermodesulfobacteriota bacterium]|nr:MAG: type II toxin-antitoxin system PemK/MazF family toxin [Thermodesulfobacteriota bacterium]